MENKTSVVIPYYNNTDFIGAAISSVQAQTSPVKEIIVVNDGSKPESREYLAQFSDQVTIVDHPVNKGIANARNTGAKHASGEYIAFLDADDLWDENKVATQEKLLSDNPNLSGCHTGINIFAVEGEIKEQCCDKPHILDFDNSKIDSHVVPSSFMIKRSAFEEVGGFDPDVLTEDYDLFLSLLTLEHQIQFIPEPLVWFRRAGHGNFSNTWQFILIGRFQILKKHWKTLYKKNGFMSLLHFSHRNT